MKKIVLSLTVLLFTASCGLTITPDRCGYEGTYFHGECVDFDRGDKDRSDHEYDGPDNDTYSGPDDDGDDDPEADTESSHPNSGRGNGSEGDPDKDPGKSEDKNNGGD